MPFPNRKASSTTSGFGLDWEKEYGQTNNSTTSSPAAIRCEDESESDTDRDEMVARLARTFTQHSVKDAEGQYVNPFEAIEDPLLDPNSGSFNPRAWIKTLIGIASRDSERYPSRVSGISCRNLNVITRIWRAHGLPKDVW